MSSAIRSGAIFSILLTALAASAEDVRPDTTGLYPIWEGTGHVEASGGVRIGTTGAQVGIGGFAHAGIMPVNFIQRAPNAYFKLALVETQTFHVAAQAGAYRLLSGATRDLFSPMFASRMDNSDFDVTMLPVSLSASWEAARWLEIHQTATALRISGAGDRIATAVTPGYSVVGELNPHSRHGLSLHLAEVGFWRHDMTIAGASYRYRNGWMEYRVGYFYRFTKSGVQSSPIASLAVLL